MININRETVIPTVDATIGILRAHNNIMPNFVDLERLNNYISNYSLIIRDMEGPLFEAVKGDPYLGIPLASYMGQFVNNNMNTRVFQKTSRGAISLSKTSIAAAIESGTISPEHVKLLQDYQKYSNCVKTRRTLFTYLQFPQSDLYSFEGHRMLMVMPNWRGQNTGRIAMYEPAIQNIPRDIQNIFTVPKGWVHVHTDSGQVEPRIIYSKYIPDPQIQALIRLYNDAYYGVLHYLDLSDYDILSGTTNFTPMEITDEMKENRKTLKTHNNAVMYGSKSNPTGDPIKAKMIRRIGEHPLRLKWIKELEDKINRGVTKFPAAFGTLIDISNSPKLSEDDDNDYIGQEKIKLAINNPIQGTAAELMRVSVAEANKLLSLKAKNSYILNYIHDAGTFAIYEDEWDSVGEQIKDIVSYNVEGWLPIEAEPEIGTGKGAFPELY